MIPVYDEDADGDHDSSCVDDFHDDYYDIDEDDGVMVLMHNGDENED